MNYKRLTQEMTSITAAITRDLEKELKDLLDRCGLYYKCFCRVKTASSACEKIETRYSQGKTDYKLQDILGIRIVVYFKKDIPLCEKIISNNYTVDNISKDEEDDETFRPQRINYVCKLPQSVIDNINPDIWSYPIDQTFEIQVRTIFSEGWHEVEHDFRYKCLDEWNGNSDLSRTLNGVWATLDNCDWAIENLLSELAHRHYKNKEWIPMLKNVFRMRISDDREMDEIIACFEQDNSLAKQFLRLDREDFLFKLSDSGIKFPMKLSSIVYIANYIEIKNEALLSLTPPLLVQKCHEVFD